MIAHVVLCTLKRDLSRTDRERFLRAIRTALAAIPTIRRSSVGRRLEPGEPYSGTGDVEYDYVAVIEFDDEAGLRGYLEHPTHAELASMFWTCCTRTLVADYRLLDAATTPTDAFAI